MGVVETTMTLFVRTPRGCDLPGCRGIAAMFNDPNLVLCAGLVPVMRLVEQVDLPVW
jgi:hypothetical protein